MVFPEHSRGYGQCVWQGHGAICWHGSNYRNERLHQRIINHNRDTRPGRLHCRNSRNSYRSRWIDRAIHGNGYPHGRLHIRYYEFGKLDLRYSECCHGRLHRPGNVARARRGDDYGNCGLCERIGHSHRRPTRSGVDYDHARACHHAAGRFYPPATHCYRRL